MTQETTSAPQPTDSATSQPADTATVADSTIQSASTAQDTTTATTEAKTPEPQPGAPESYSFVAPEGSEYDSGIIEAYSGIAKELNLTQDGAQKLLETMAPAIAARQTEQIKAVQARWAEASKTDTEFGGEKLQENLAVAIKARDALATPELRQLLDETGLDNHPEVVRFFYRTGKALSEDSFSPGRSNDQASAPTVAQRMYPNMNP